MKKLLSYLLLSAMLASTLASCSSGGGTSGNDTTASGEETEQTTTAETTAEPTNADIISETYAGTDFDGYSFRILSISPGKHFYIKTSETENEVFYETETGDKLNDAIVERNRKTEDLLNVKIVPVWGGTPQEVQDNMKKSVSAGDNSFDVVLDRLDFMMNSSAEGMLMNVLDIESINVKNPWWDTSIVNTFMFHENQLYVLAGDLNYYDDYAVQAMFYSKKICEDLGHEQLYDSVREGKWVFDSMEKLAIEASADLNGDSKYTFTDDRYGYVNHSNSLIQLVFGFDSSMTSVVNGEIVINFDEKMINNVQKVYDFHKKSPGIETTLASADYQSAFKDSRAMFFPEMVGSLPNFRQMEGDFGVLPMPKLDEKQERYTAFVSNGWTTSYSIPVTVSDAERAGTVLEAMSAFSTNTVKSILYEVLLQNKLIRDVDSKEMLEYVFNSKVYDWAADLAWGKPIIALYAALRIAPSFNYVSQMESQMTAFKTSLDNFMANYDK